MTKEGQPEKRREALDEASLCLDLSGGAGGGRQSKDSQGCAQEGMSAEGGVFIGEVRGLNGKRSRIHNSPHLWSS